MWRNWSFLVLLHASLSPLTKWTRPTQVTPFSLRNTTQHSKARALTRSLSLSLFLDLNPVELLGHYIIIIFKVHYCAAFPGHNMAEAYVDTKEQSDIYPPLTVSKIKSVWEKCRRVTSSGPYYYKDAWRGWIGDGQKVSETHFRG